MAYLGTLRFNDKCEYEVNNNVEITNLNELFNTMLWDTVQLSIMNGNGDVLVDTIDKLTLQEFYKSWTGKRKYNKKNNTIKHNKNNKLYTYRIGKLDFDDEILQDCIDKEIMISVKEMEKEDIEDLENMQKVDKER